MGNTNQIEPGKLEKTPGRTAGQATGWPGMSDTQIVTVTQKRYNHTNDWPFFNPGIIAHERKYWNRQTASARATKIPDW